MAQFLNQEEIRFRNLKTFLTDHAATLKAHARAMVEREGRPYSYLASAGSRKEQRAREIAEEDVLAKVWCACVYSWSPAIPFPSGSGRASFCQLRPAQVSAYLLLLHGSEIWPDPCHPLPYNLQTDSVKFIHVPGRRGVGLQFLPQI